MWDRIIFSLRLSLEWRAIAFVITVLFFWITTGEFVEGTILSFILQFILLMVHFFWHLLREQHFHKKAAKADKVQ